MKKPNILLITSDQHRADSMSCSGHPSVQTPHLDQLAYEGIRFDNAYSDCPVCIPARTTLITGIQAHRYGMPQYNSSYRIQRKREDFLGSLITKAGYQTQLIGKTHWHTDNTFRAGFEGLVSLFALEQEKLSKMGLNYGTNGIGYNEITPDMSQTPAHLHQTNLLVDKCLEFLENRERNQPFFLWASFHDPHPPLTIHEPYYSMYDNDDIPEPVFGDWCEGEDCPVSHYMNQMMMKTHLMSRRQLRKARSVYYGMLTNMDYQLGRLYAKLMTQDVWDNTLVIYTSDHGDFLGDHGCAKKSSFCEASARLPFIIRPPKSMDVKSGRISDALVGLEDILPTLCEIAGIDAPSDITGKSLCGIIEGQQEKVRHYLHGHISDTHMYHDGRYKYIYNADDGKELLFDTSNDRNDMKNIKGDPLERIRELFTHHLVEEDHPHVVNGKLLNKGKQKPDAAEALAKDGMGLRPVDKLTFIAKGILGEPEEK